MAQKFRLGGLLNRGDREDRSSTVFVAATQETMDRGWLLEALLHAEHRIASAGLQAKFEPWNKAFSAGDITVEKLIDLSTSVAAAIVVLTGDDVTVSREEESTSPRDNLVFESGLFVSHLGLDRTLLLKEIDAKLPSDLLGVTLVPFHSPEGQDGPSDVAIQELGRQIFEFVSEAKIGSHQEADSAVTRALAQSLEKADEKLSEVNNAIRGRTRRDGPIVMPDPPTAYVDAVNEVQERFLTTTYLNSEFWTMTRDPVIDANRGLVDRLANEGVARRLIILPRSVKDEIRAQREWRRSLRSGQPKLVEERDKEFKALERANTKLMKAGFEVRVVYDHEELWRELPDGMRFAEGDTELAVFDEARVDIYTGFVRAGLPEAKVFDATTHDSFGAIYDRTVDYLTRLWESEHAAEFSTFAEELTEVIEESKHEIDYEKNWLLRFDEDADPGDARLKREELKFVVGCLSSGRDAQATARHLDLGTCTGRYLSELRECVDICLSVGIDLDVDCLEHCRWKHREALRDGGRFQVLDADIRDGSTLPNGDFDLITCMMGTLCHLRRSDQRSAVYEDPWQVGLENLATRLSADGDAFVAIWNVESPSAAAPSLLSIYPQRTNEILLRQSPPQKEFEARLGQVELKTVGHSLIQQRLHVYHLQHA